MHALSPNNRGPNRWSAPLFLRVVYLAIRSLDCDARARSLSSCTDYHHLMSNPLLNEPARLESSFLFAVIHISFASEALALAKFTPTKY